MAILDYGAIAFHNGKCVSTGMFTPMKTTVGYTCKYHVDPDKEWDFDGNYFAVIGNEWFLMGFYKSLFTIAMKDEDIAPIKMRKVCSEYLDGGTPFKGWRAWQKTYFGEDEFAEVKIMHKNGYYCAKIKIATIENYKRIIKDKWKVFFGYGVDYEFYKKTRCANYYRSPVHLFKRVIYKLKGFFRLQK